MPARTGQHRVARDRDQGADLALPRRLDLLDQARDRHLAQHLFGTANTGGEPAEICRTVFETRYGLRGQRPCGRPREHRTTDGVEMAAEDVDDIDQPTRQTAEFLITQ